MTKYYLSQKTLLAMECYSLLKVFLKRIFTTNNKSIFVTKYYTFSDKILFVAINFFSDELFHC